MFKIDADVDRLVESHAGAGGKPLSYLPWAVGLGLAGRPPITIVEFEGHALAREIFGGAAVAAEIDGQRVYLPVQDDGFHPIKFEDATPRDIGDTQSRCRAKAIAMCTGVGLSVYADFKGDGPAFAKALGPITADTDLFKVNPMVLRKPRSKEESKTGHHTGPAYLPWPAAIAAAKLADEGFRWKIEEREFLNTANGEVRMEPFTRFGTGFAVGITVTYRGETHTEWSPILGTAKVQTSNGLKTRDNEPILDPNINHWNKAVMRCLVKAIAVKTGYGLSVYAKADFIGDGARPVANRSEKPKAQQAARSESQGSKSTAALAARQRANAGATSVPEDELTIEQMVKRVSDLAVKANLPESKLLTMLNVTSLDKASKPQLTQVGRMLERRAAAAAKRPADGGSQPEEQQQSLTEQPRTEGAESKPSPATEAKERAGKEAPPEANGDASIATLVQQVRDLAARANMPEDKVLGMLNVTSLDKASKPQLTQVSRMLERRAATVEKRAAGAVSRPPTSETEGAAKAEAEPSAEQPEVVPPVSGGDNSLLHEVLALAKQANLSQDRLCSWMEVRKATDADEKTLKKVRLVLKAMIAKGAQQAAA